MKIDFTDTSFGGIVLIPEGRYTVKLTDWYKRTKEDTGNIVFDMDFEIQEGKFKGQNLRHFQTLSNNAASKPMFLGLLGSLGVAKEEDRGPKGELEVELKYGGQDDRNRQEVKKVLVNGQERPATGYKAIAVVTHRKTDDGEKRHNVQRIEPLQQPSEPPAPSDTVEAAAETASNGGKTLEDVW